MRDVVARLEVACANLQGALYANAEKFWEWAPLTSPLAAPSSPCDVEAEHELADALADELRKVREALVKKDSAVQSKDALVGVLLAQNEELRSKIDETNSPCTRSRRCSTSGLETTF